MAYRVTVFTKSFVDNLRAFVDPITDALRRLDNKDKLDTDPPDAKDVVGVLKQINFDPWVEDLFTDTFNASAPLWWWQSTFWLQTTWCTTRTLLAVRTVRAASSEKFRTDLTLKNMMRYLIDSILLTHRTVKKSSNVWDTASYLEPEEDDSHEARPSRSRRSLAHANPTAEGFSAGPLTSRRRVTSPSTDRARKNKKPRATTSSRRWSTLNFSGMSALAHMEDDEDHRPRAKQTTRYLATPVVEDDHSSQDDQASKRRAPRRPRGGRHVHDPIYTSTEKNKKINARHRHHRRPNLH